MKSSLVIEKCEGQSDGKIYVVWLLRIKTSLKVFSIMDYWFCLGVLQRKIKWQTQLLKTCFSWWWRLLHRNLLFHTRFIWLGNKLSFLLHSMSRISLKLESIESLNQGALQKTKWKRTKSRWVKMLMMRFDDELFKVEPWKAWRPRKSSKETINYRVMIL